jgi:DNA-binding MarR family transcriptional regulator
MPGYPPEMSSSADARALTEVVTRLRRVLRASIRSDYPWEALPMAQVELLMALREQPPARVGELAIRLRLAPNTVSGLVQQLVVNGLVTRQASTADRRAAMVILTEAGRAQLVAWDNAHRERIGTALEHLPPGERAAVHAALPALAHLVEHLAEPARAEPAGVVPPAAPAPPPH